MIWYLGDYIKVAEHVNLPITCIPKLWYTLHIFPIVLLNTQSTRDIV